MYNNFVRSHVKLHGFNCFTLIFFFQVQLSGCEPTQTKTKKGVWTESLETEMHGTHSFIQPLKGANISGTAIYHIKQKWWLLRQLE